MLHFDPMTTAWLVRARAMMNELAGIVERS